ncbi:MAG: cysteine--tRNA ligase [Proteobacteria bacterium]|nr:cysteine--tRNA ligase [Pseudomonadota bacterium]MDA1356296.1 cysteine--tRNA ligase [Pseudomonadota bacterium]
MALSLHNTQTRKKKLFEPLDASRVSMYVCGPTVYDLAHIGNARPIVVFDVLYRLLRNIYGQESVIYVRNITDVDDKINAAAQASGEPISAITARTTKAFHDDIAELNALPPDVEPRATDHIPEMIEMIKTLIASNHAYAAEGHVLFHVPSDQGYGKLSNREREEMLAGARVEVAPYKRDPADFVLWKPSDEALPGWDSPWGRGRPGWHIECSAMSRKHLGVTLDIHGGGADLIFPHHENEVAQSECSCPGHPFVRTWVHNGFLSVNGEKMSKSLGNFITIRQALEGAPGEVLRLMLLSTHYRHPLDWTEEGVQQARTRLDRLYRVLQNVNASGGAEADLNVAVSEDAGFIAALHDDLNTPLALSELERQTDELSKLDGSEARRKRRAVMAGAGILGILQQDPETWFKGGETASDVGHIEEQIALRLAARGARDFDTADKIRDALVATGIVLEDRPDGTTNWRRVG